MEFIKWNLDPEAPTVQEQDEAIQEKIDFGIAKDSKEALQRLQDPKFYKTLRSYYSHTTPDEDFNSMNEAELLEYFYEDRTWGNLNTVGMYNDLDRIQEEKDEFRNKEFGYIQDTYNKLPSWWDNDKDPRGFGTWLLDVGGALVLDPVNLVGFGAGGAVAKTAVNASIKNALKDRALKELTKEMLEESIERGTKGMYTKAIGYGAGIESLIGAGYGYTHDHMIQSIEMKTGLRNERDLQQTLRNTLISSAFGTVFGGGFGAGGAFLGKQSFKNSAVKNMETLHNLGVNDVTGKELFNVIARPIQLKDLIGSKATTEEAEAIVRKEIIDVNKPLPSKLKDLGDESYNTTNQDGIAYVDKDNERIVVPTPHFNMNRYSENKEELVNLINAQADELGDEIEAVSKSLPFEQVEAMAKEFNVNPKELNDFMSNPDLPENMRKLAGRIFAWDMQLLNNGDETSKLLVMLDAPNISKKESDRIIKELEKRRQLNAHMMVIKKQIEQSVAQVLASMRAKRRFTDEDLDMKTIELIFNPTDANYKKTLEGDATQYWKKLAQIKDKRDMSKALAKPEDIDISNWDYVTEWVNNSLLSSPDTHILNITSSLVQTQLKPATMLIRAAYLSNKDSQLAKTTAREAMDTWIYTMYYTVDGMKQFWRTLYAGRPILDPVAMKQDAIGRQNLLVQWADNMDKLWNKPDGVLGDIAQGAASAIALPYKASMKTITFPMRFLGAGDEGLKYMNFKARAAAQANTIIMREFPDLMDNPTLYKQKFAELISNLQDTQGRLISNADSKHSKLLTAGEKSLYNDPAYYARESTYTASAYFRDPETNKLEGGIGGAILKWAGKNRWSRAFGLNFINTPSNLLRHTWQHSPLGYSHFAMKQAKKKKKDGTYFDPSAAAEADARVTMGYMIWMAAITAAMTGKVTGGGSRDYKVNEERKALTGWQEYSVKDGDTYISMNRLDPLFMPFGIAADMWDVISDYLANNHQDDVPEEEWQKVEEVAMGTLAAVTRNLTSKFYTKSLMETVDLLLGDGALYWQDPIRKGGQMVQRHSFKFVPLSGGLRYADRIQRDHEKEYRSLQDRLATLNPFDGDNRIMPRRNMFGEPIDRRKGWMFGIGDDKGWWSSPFAMSKASNSRVADFFNTEGREIQYLRPSNTHKDSNLDLTTIRNSDNQTAYDRWLELKGEITTSVLGVPIYISKDKDSPYYKKALTLKQAFDEEVLWANSALNKTHPDPDVKGKDLRQAIILGLVRKYEKYALEHVLREFPIIDKTARDINVTNMRKAMEWDKKRRDAGLEGLLPKSLDPEKYYPPK